MITENVVPIWLDNAVAFDVGKGSYREDGSFVESHIIWANRPRYTFRGPVYKQNNLVDLITEFKLTLAYEEYFLNAIKFIDTNSTGIFPSRFEIW